MSQRKHERAIKRLLPKVSDRIKSLPPEFTHDLKTALVGAELMFRTQGGCAPVAHVLTTEDGEFLSPVPDHVQSNEEIRQHLWDLLTAKPGARAVSFSFTCTPQGGGSADGSSSLVCLVMTSACLYEMRSPITGVRSLGRWTVVKHVGPGLQLSATEPAHRESKRLIDIILTGVGASDLCGLPGPVRQMTRGGVELTWVSLEEDKVEQTIPRGAAWYLWPAHYVDGSRRHTMRIVLPTMPYFVTKVDLIALSGDSSPSSPELVVITWHDWLNVAPIVGTVLDEGAVLVHDARPPDAWPEMYRRAKEKSLLNV